METRIVSRVLVLQDSRTMRNGGLADEATSGDAAEDAFQLG